MKVLKLPLLALALTAVALVAACGGDDDDATPTPGSGTAAPVRDVTLRLGYFANVTHAQALIGVADGSLQKDLGEHVKLETKVFNAGPAAIDALFAGDIDATYVGPNPAINGFQKSNGDEVRIVAGAASAGALFIVRPAANITTAKDLAGKKLATPQLGNTQDVALRAYIKQNGLKSKDDGGSVTILPTANADTLTLFKKGDIDGAWVPEPWASRLVLEAGGKVFLDERSLWPSGDFVTTQLIVSAKFLKDNPGAVEKLVRSDIRLTRYINDNPEQAKSAANKQIQALTGAALSQDVIDSAWKNIKFTYDPIAGSLAKSAKDAFDAGLLANTNLKGIYALETLNRVLNALDLPTVKTE